MSLLNNIYNNSPVFLQNAFVSLYGFYWKNRRYGKAFEKHLEEAKNRESFSKKEWEVYQTIQLRNLLIHSFKNVPFYNKKYSKAGFSAKDFESFEIKDLKKLPCLTKDELRTYGSSTLLAVNKAKGKFYSSSGSTGTPIKVYFSKDFHRKWSALYEARVRNWAGVDYKMSRAMIGGRRVLSNSKLKPPFYRYNLAEKQAYFSAYHISSESSEQYVKELDKTKIKYLVGYATSIYLLSKNIQELGIKAPKLLAVLTSSEKLTEQMRFVIENVFQCKVFDAYSGVEACGLISENEFGELLFSPDSGILEILDENGEEVLNGELGEVVSTGLLNYDQPLIRYRIGDCITLSKNQNSNGILNMPIIKQIEGRVEDVIVGENGREMVRFHGIFIDIIGLIQSQLIQEKVNLIRVKLVVEKEFDKSQETIIVKRIVSQLGEVEINFEYVNTIGKTISGKYKAVISRLKNG